MSERIYNLYEAKTALSELVERAASGEEVIIAKAGKPMARLVPIQKGRRKRREPGGWEGRVKMGRDFDAPLPRAVLAAFGADDS